jgi:hypothetical protein
VGYWSRGDAFTRLRLKIAFLLRLCILVSTGQRPTPSNAPTKKITLMLKSS